jgi:hypothetical protein
MKNWAWILGMALTATIVGAQTTANRTNNREQRQVKERRAA